MDLLVDATETARAVIGPQKNNNFLNHFFGLTVHLKYFVHCLLRTRTNKTPNKIGKALEVYVHHCLRGLWSTYKIDRAELE